MNELTESELADFRDAASGFLASLEHLEAKHPQLGMIPGGSAS